MKYKCIYFYFINYFYISINLHNYFYRLKYLNKIYFRMSDSEFQTPSKPV